jgi:hypothetical protein
MKGFIVSALFFSGLVNAQSIQVKVSDFNFTYQDPYGEGSATSFSRSFQGEAVQVKVEKSAKDFLLSTSGAENQEFTFRNAPSFMTDAETMSVKGFNLNFGSALSMSLQSGRFLSHEDSLKLDGLSLSCSRDITHKDDMDQLIMGCVNQMTLKSSRFSSESVKSGIVDILTSAFRGATGTKADVGVSSLELKTQKGKYNLEADVKAQISGKVKSNGNMNYDPATGKMILKISEVKFGFINITGKVFDELEKNESEKLKVKKPYVYYSIK